MNIAIVYTLPTKRAQQSRFIAADVDTAESAYEIRDALLLRSTSVSMHPVSEESISSITSVKGDVIVNLIDWDGPDLPLSLAAWKAVEDTGIPFTGSSFKTFRKLATKAGMKRAIKAAGLPVPDGYVVKKLADVKKDSHSFPLIVKLSEENCSIGLSHDSVCHNQVELERVVADRLSRFGEELLVEEFVSGREFQVTVLDMAKTGIFVLPPAEILYKTRTGDELLTYESRWDPSHPDYQASTVGLAELSPVLLKRINDISRKAFTSLGLADYTRLDIRCRGDEPLILEANVNPGLGDDDEYGMTLSCKALGISFSDLLWEIINSCLRRFGSPHLPPR